jgi:N-methylhydantoinase B
MDIVLFSPVFVCGKLVAVTSTIAHHIDIGGKIPGTEAADNIEVFAEGLILPPLKLLEEGRPNQTIFDIVAANVRDPHSCQGDLRAQIAGCRTGEATVERVVKTEAEWRAELKLEAVR